MSEVKTKLNSDSSIGSIKLSTNRRLSDRSTNSKVNLRKNSDKNTSGSKKNFKSQFNTK